MTGMPPATAASKFSATPLLLGQPRQRRAVVGEQRLVGGDHMLAGLHRGLDRGLGRIALAAHQFDEDVDGRIGRQRHGIVMPDELRQVMATVFPCDRAGLRP